MQPSLLGPRDHLNRAPTAGDRSLEQQRKRRVSDGRWGLTSPNGKRQNTKTQSRGRGKSIIVTHERGSHETNQITLSGANRNSTVRSKSEQLKEGLAGGSATNSVGEECFSIPHDHHQAWIKKGQLIQNRMSLGAADSEDENGLEIGSLIVLTHFRRGHVVLGAKTGVSINLDSDGKFNVFEGGRERKECGFPLKEVKDVWVRSVILLCEDSVLRLVIDKQHQGLCANRLVSGPQWYISLQHTTIRWSDGSRNTRWSANLVEAQATVPRSRGQILQGPALRNKEHVSGKYT